MTRAADLAKLIAGGGSITVDDNATTLSLVSTDADANSGPVQVLYRNSSSPADSDLVGEMHFRGRNDNSQDVEYVTISTRMEDVSDGTEDGKIILKTIVDGTARSRIEIDHTDVVINQDSIDSNFRVESNNQAGMIFVDAGNDRVGIGTVSPNHDLHLHKSTSDGNFLLITNSTTGSNSNDGAAIGLAADETLLIYHQESSDIRFGTGATERMRIDSDGHVGIGTTDPQVGLQVEASDGSVNGTIRLTATGVASAGMAMDANGLNFGADTGGFVFKTSATANDPSDTGTTRMRIDSSGQVQVNGNQTLLDSDTFFQVNVNGGNGDNAFMAIACNGSNTANQEAGIYLGRTNNRIMTTVDGSANFRDDIQIRAGGSGGVSLSSGATSFAGASDEKLKTIIENITGALDNVAKLRTVIGRYEWDAEDKRRSFLIAQDVQTVLPEVVEENPEGNLMLDYTGVIPLLTAALKEAKTKIETLETKVTALESK
jgi:hypothetical protein